MLTEPDFAGTDSARRAIKLLEERTTLQDLLARTTTNSAVGGLQVLIGGDGGWEELERLFDGAGTLRCAGPSPPARLASSAPCACRTPGRIPTVRFVAGLLERPRQRTPGRSARLEPSQKRKTRVIMANEKSEESLEHQGEGAERDRLRESSMRFAPSWRRLRRRLPRTWMDGSGPWPSSRTTASALSAIDRASRRP